MNNYAVSLKEEVSHESGVKRQEIVASEIYQGLWEEECKERKPIPELLLIRQLQADWDEEDDDLMVA